MELKRIKIYAIVLLTVGIIIFFFNFLQLNGLSTFLETLKLEKGQIPEITLGYIFPILLLAILISLFILLFFGISKQQETNETTLNIPDFDETKIEESLNKDNQESLLVEKKLNKFLLDLDNFNDINELLSIILRRLSKELNIVQGIAFLKNKNNKKFKLAAKYAYYILDKEPEYELGEGLVGQVAQDKKTLYINQIPDSYLTVLSGLGNSNPKYLAIIPIVKNDETVAIIEIASFSDLSNMLKQFSNALNKLLVNKISY